MYTTDHIFTVLPIKHLVNQYGGPTTPHELATGTKPSVSKPTCFILFKCCTKVKCTCWHKGVKYAWSIIIFFRCIFVGIPQHQKGDLFYTPSTQKIISLHDFVFDETFYITLSYKSRPYSEKLAMRSAVSYIL